VGAVVASGASGGTDAGTGGGVAGTVTPPFASGFRKAGNDPRRFLVLFRLLLLLLLMLLLLLRLFLDRKLFLELRVVPVGGFNYFRPALTGRAGGAGKVVAQVIGSSRIVVVVDVSVAGVADVIGVVGVVSVDHASVDVGQRHSVGADLLQDLRRYVAPVAASGGGVAGVAPTAPWRRRREPIVGLDVAAPIAAQLGNDAVDVRRVAPRGGRTAEVGRRRRRRRRHRPPEVADAV